MIGAKQLLQLNAIHENARSILNRINLGVHQDFAKAVHLLRRESQRRLDARIVQSRFELGERTKRPAETGATFLIASADNYWRAHSHAVWTHHAVVHLPFAVLPSALARRGFLVLRGSGCLILGCTRASKHEAGRCKETGK